MQTARLQGWRLIPVNDREVVLTGIVSAHPSTRFSDGAAVTTSWLRSIDFERGIAVTQNTIYILEDASK